MTAGSDTVPAVEQHLMFRAGSRSFAIAGSRVERVARYCDAGDVVLADLSSMLGDPPAVVGEHTCVVVVAAGHQLVALVVDEANDVVSITSGDLVVPPDFGPRIDTGYLSALIRSGSTFSIVLDVDRLLGGLLHEDVTHG